MGRMRPVRLLLFLSLGASLNAAPIHPVGHDDEGLPSDGQPMAVYAADPAHPLNRLHALLFIARRTPTEIGAALPAERRRAGQNDVEFFTGKWALAHRKDAAIDPTADTRWFGGDVRTSPVGTW